MPNPLRHARPVLTELGTLLALVLIAAAYGLCTAWILSPMVRP